LENPQQPATASIIDFPGPGTRLAGKLSIVLITWNRRAEILRTLARLVALPGQPAICVVDNGSTDGSADAIAVRFPTVRLLRLPQNRGAAARNVGVRSVTTPYVAFCDDDTWWAGNSLARGVALLENYPRLAAVTARVLVGPAHREDPTNVAMATSPLPRLPKMPDVIPVAGLLAGACIMRRDAFLDAGGYEPRFFLGSEERLLALDLMAAGWRLGWSRDLIVHHFPSLQRDSEARTRMQLRNALWCAWLRRPFASAWHESASLLAAAKGRPGRWSAVFGALAGLPWVLANRQVIPRSVEAALWLVENAPPLVDPTVSRKYTSL
jgi:GT2 family glycosyltransferase